MFMVIFMAGRIWEKWSNISERAKWSKCPSISSSFMGEWVIACLLPDQDQGRLIHHLSGCDPKLYIPKYYKIYPYELAQKMSLAQKSRLRTIKCTKALNYIFVLTMKVWYCPDARRPNISKNSSKSKRLIWVFVVLGIYNFDVTTDTPPVGPLTTIIFMAIIYVMEIVNTKSNIRKLCSVFTMRFFPPFYAPDLCCGYVLGTELIFFL